MFFYKLLFILIKPVGWIYLTWQLPFITKIKEFVGLVYCVLTKRNRILVAYTKNHPRMNTIAQNPPTGILFVCLTTKFSNKNFLIKFLASKIDIIYEDGPTTFSLTTKQPIIKEFEHHYFEKDKLANQQIKKIFVMSQWAKPNFDDQAHKIEVLYPAIPLRNIRAKKTESGKKPLIIFMAGAAAARKGADILFTAFERVEQSFGPNKLLLVMASNYKNNSKWYPVNQECLDRTKQIYEKCKHKNNVYFGHIYPPIVIDYFYQYVDIYVLPTRFETFGFSIVEAMSYSLPIITTNLTAIPEIVKHEENGFLIETENFDVQGQEYFEYAVGELEKYLKILIEDTPLRLKMGQESGKRIERKFNIEHKKNRLKQLFTNIVQKD